ncbi:hypothetical protein F4819DRAFT_441671 [Hypoxylon fuscum]|nr:hypothetical protein F4819DRAFT_441671 [Hypoxylon fuscum]
MRMNYCMLWLVLPIAFSIEPGGLYAGSSSFVCTIMLYHANCSTLGSTTYFSSRSEVGRRTAASRYQHHCSNWNRRHVSPTSR